MKKDKRQTIRKLIILFLAFTLFVGGISGTILLLVPKNGLPWPLTLAIVAGIAIVFILLYYFLIHKARNR